MHAGLLPHPPQSNLGGRGVFALVFASRLAAGEHQGKHSTVIKFALPRGGTAVQAKDSLRIKALWPFENTSLCYHISRHVHACTGMDLSIDLKPRSAARIDCSQCLVA